MRITGVETRIVDAGMRNWVFVKVLTDQPGLHGWGEATLEWKTRAVAACVDDLTPLVAGQDPLAIEHLVQTMTKHGFWRLGAIGLSAVSGIEQALWDIKGKALGVPVWQLLGGKVRERVRLYTHLALGDSAAVYEAPDVGRLKAHADDIVAAGYSAFKVLLVPPTHYRAALPDVRQTGMLMDALRDHVGDGVDIMVDLHGRPPSVAVARAYVEALTPGRPLFVEEVLPPGHEIAMRDVAVASKVPLATGERLYARPDWLALFAHRSVDIVQPDLSHCGGLWEARKIAAMAESHLMGVAPHNPNGPVAGAAALHFDIATPNSVIQETMLRSVPWYDEVVRSTLVVQDGHWLAPDAPGLGIEIDESAAARHPMGAEPMLARSAVAADGTVLDW